MTTKWLKEYIEKKSKVEKAKRNPKTLSDPKFVELGNAMEDSRKKCLEEIIKLLEVSSIDIFY